LITRLTFLFLFSAAALESGETPDNHLILDLNFYNELYKTHPVLRDTYLDSRLNSIVAGRGQIQSVDIYQRLKKNYRLILVDRETMRSNMTITYHIYISDANVVSLLKKNELFEFSGQLVAYTPLSVKRDSYIFDIILEKGAMVFE
jgi:hypothetical protein